jgi:hypothetical protein
MREVSQAGRAAQSRPAPEPLEIVDRDDELVVGEQLQGAADRHPESPRVDGGTRRLLEEERDFERPALRRRQRRQNVAEDSVEQIAQTGVGQSSVRLDRPRREDTQPAPARRFDRRAPDPRLPDPRVALQGDCARALHSRRAVEECVQRAELFGPGDDFDCHRSSETS